MDSYNLVCYFQNVFLSSNLIAAQSQPQILSIFRPKGKLCLENISNQNLEVESYDLNDDIHSIFYSNKSLVIVTDSKIHRHQSGKTLEFENFLSPKRKVVLKFNLDGELNLEPEQYFSCK